MRVLSVGHRSAARSSDAHQLRDELKFDVLAYQSLARYTDAEPLYRRAMEVLQTKLGLDHPYTVKMRKNCDLLQEQNNRMPAMPRAKPD